jgi:four helix bundle protein
MKKLENSVLWKSAIKLADDSYKMLDDLPEEEEWGMQSKLRGRAVDLTTEIAEALGSIDPRDKKHYLGHARKTCFGLIGVYSLMRRTGVVPVLPDTLIALSELSSMIEKEIEKADKDIPGYMIQFQIGSNK